MRAGSTGKDVRRRLGAGSAGGGGRVERRGGSGSGGKDGMSEGVVIGASETSE